MLAPPTIRVLESIRYFSSRDVAQPGSALAWGVQKVLFLAFAITSLANVYRPFLTFAFAGFSQNRPQKTNGASNGSIKNCPDENRKKVFKGSVSCQVSSDDFGKIISP
jgi:hypothetical protein